jgi:hypothetical protein
VDSPILWLPRVLRSVRYALECLVNSVRSDSRAIRRTYEEASNLSVKISVARSSSHQLFQNEKGGHNACSRQLSDRQCPIARLSGTRSARCSRTKGSEFRSRPATSQRGRPVRFDGAPRIKPTRRSALTRAARRKSHPAVSFDNTHFLSLEKALGAAQELSMVPVRGA